MPGASDNKEMTVELTAHVFVTLDGVVQGPGHAEEDTRGGFTAGGWQAPYVEKVVGEISTRPGPRRRG